MVSSLGVPMNCGYSSSKSFKFPFEICSSVTGGRGGLCITLL